MNQDLLNKIAFLVLIISSSTKVFSQRLDTSANIRSDYVTQLKFSKEDISYDGKDSVITLLEDSVWSSILHIDDKKIQKFLFSVTVKEYKNGVKISEENIFKKASFDQSNLFSTTEDSSCVFSFFRKQIDTNTIKFGYRIAPETITRTYKVSDIDNFIMVAGITNPVPLEKPFTWLIYTLPDNTNNFPFYKPDIKGKVDPSDWSEVFKLKHSFVIELTIYRPF